VGIVSHYALITNSARAVTELSDFPSQQFNHVILCVPSAKDTIWLECTSQESPFNTLGSSNENRHALLVTPDGGRLVRTPASAPEANAQIRRIAANLDSRGNVVMDVRVDLTGNQQEDVRGSLVGASPTDRDEWLRGYVEIPSFTVRSADYSAVAPRTSRGNLRFGLEVPKYATQTANRLVLNPNVMAKRRYVPKALTNRKFPVRFTYRYLDSDTVLFKIPAGFRVEALPKPVTLEADFGSFASWATALSDSVIMYTRTVRLNATELPAARYQEYRDYAGKIAVADKAVVSLVRKP
jgi:hypothetical protein